MRSDALILLAILVSSCGVDGSPTSAGSQAYRAQMASAQAAGWRVDPVKGSIGLLEVGMSRERIISLDLPMRWGKEEQEGAVYETVTVTALGDVTIQCILSDEIVYRCSSDSTRLRDPAGKGVGSSLGELKRAYPHGRLLVSYENGKNANFIVGGRMMFSMDAHSIKEECFELEQCVFDEHSLRVVRIVITDI